jgi:NAD(P)-dependent dehydrogenase (short-subunit alcohol dehydrogenase family)
MRWLEGQVALVTGGNIGIGAATSRRLAAEGASVAVGFFEDQDAAEELAGELSKTGPRCCAIHGDVRSSSSVLEMVEGAQAALGNITVLVNNAGVARHTPFLEISEEEFDWIFQTNVNGTFRCTKAVLSNMLTAGHGSIVNISSELALIGEPELVHYVAAKSAIIGFTKALAREVGPRGVRVNTVCPGPTDTRILTDAERTEEYARTLPLRRLGTPDEIAATIAFLCSADGGWYTGQVLSPNGGAVI